MFFASHISDTLLVSTYVVYDRCTYSSKYETTPSLTEQQWRRPVVNVKVNELHLHSLVMQHRLCITEDTGSTLYYVPSPNYGWWSWAIYISCISFQYTYAAVHSIFRIVTILNTFMSRRFYINGQRQRCLPSVCIRDRLWIVIQVIELQWCSVQVQRIEIPYKTWSELWVLTKIYWNR